MKIFCQKINFNRGLFRLSFLISFVLFAWGSFVEAPKYFPVAFGFTEADKNEIIEKYGRYSEKIKDNPEYFIEWYFGKNLSSQIQLGQKYMGEREGRPCGNSSSEILNRAIDRVVDSECLKRWIDYSGGYLVSNRAHNIIAKHSSWVLEEKIGVSVFEPDEDGYSIIPQTTATIKFVILCGLWYAIPGFLFFGFVLPFSLYIIKIIYFYFFKKYFYWVWNGFIS